MPVVFGKKRSDGKVEVGTVWYRATSHPQGWSVAEVPSYPAGAEGVQHVMVYDPQTGSFAFEARGITSGEAELRRRLAALEARVRDLSGEGPA